MKTLLMTTIIATAFAGAASAEDMNTRSDTTTGVNTNVSTSAATISKLPNVGAAVNLSGTVKDIDVVDNEFTLQDKSGATIDVETEDKLTVKKGDQVSVNGKISEDMGEKEISAGRVTVTASADESDSHDRSAN